MLILGNKIIDKKIILLKILNIKLWRSLGYIEDKDEKICFFIGILENKNGYDYVIINSIGNMYKNINILDGVKINERQYKLRITEIFMYMEINGDLKYVRDYKKMKKNENIMKKNTRKRIKFTMKLKYNSIYMNMSNVIGYFVYEFEIYVHFHNKFTIREFVRYDRIENNFKHEKNIDKNIEIIENIIKKKIYVSYGLLNHLMRKIYDDKGVNKNNKNNKNIKMMKWNEPNNKHEIVDSYKKIYGDEKKKIIYVSDYYIDEMKKYEKYKYRINILYSKKAKLLKYNEIRKLYLFIKENKLDNIWFLPFIDFRGRIYASSVYSYTNSKFTRNVIDYGVKHCGNSDKGKKIIKFHIGILNKPKNLEYISKEEFEKFDNKKNNSYENLKYLYILNNPCEEKRRHMIFKDSTASGSQHLVRIMNIKNKKNMKYLNSENIDKGYDTYLFEKKEFINSKSLNIEEINKIKIIMNVRKIIKLMVMRTQYGGMYNMMIKDIKDILILNNVEYDNECFIILKKFYDFMNKNDIYVKKIENFMEKNYEIKLNDGYIVNGSYRIRKNKHDKLKIKYNENYVYVEKYEKGGNLEKKIYKYVLYSSSGIIDNKKCLQGFKANITHSVDAMIVREMIGYGVITVHDSFGIEIDEIENFIKLLNIAYSKKPLEMSDEIKGESEFNVI